MHPNSIHLPVPHTFPLHLHHTPERKQKACKQTNKNKNKRSQQQKPFFSSPFPPLHLSWWHGVQVCRTVCLFVLAALLANIHREPGSGTLVCGTPSSQDPHQNSSGISHGHPKSWISYRYCPPDQSLPELQEVLGGIYISVGQPQAQPQVEGREEKFTYAHALRVGSNFSEVRGGTISLNSPKTPGSALPGWSQLAFLLQCPVKVKVCFPWANKRQRWDSSWPSDFISHGFHGP